MKFKDLVIKFAIYFAVCLVLLPLMEYVYSLLVKIEYVFTLKEYLAWALAFAGFWTLRDYMVYKRGI